MPNMSNDNKSVSTIKTQVMQDKVVLGQSSSKHYINDEEFANQSGKYKVTLLLNLNDRSNQMFRSMSSIDGSTDDELYFQDDKVMRRNSATSINEYRRAVTQIKDMYVNEGIRNAELKCRVRNNNSQVEWFRDNQKIMNNNKFETVTRGDERVLIIRNPTKADNGEYVCQSGKHKVVLTLLVNSRSREMSPTLYEESVLVRKVPSLERLRSWHSFDYPELNYYEAQVATLKANLKQDTDSFVWLKDSAKLWSTSLTNLDETKYSVLQEGPVKTLIIKNVNLIDSGNYACQSKSNPENRVDFDMKVREVRPEFVQTLNGVRVQSPNDKVVLECVVRTSRTSAPLKVKWFKDGREISKELDPRYMIHTYYKDEHIDGSVLNCNKLIIQPPIGLNDQGEYMVFIEDDLNKLNSSAIISFVDGLDFVFKPEIYVRRSSLQGFQSLVPELSTRNNNDTTFTETLLYQIEPHEQRSQINIQLPPIIETEDSEHINTTTTTTTQKTIRRLKSENDLEFIKQLEPFMECDEGQDCVLECWVNKYDTAALWYLDDHPEPLNALHTHHAKYEISDVDGRKHRLVIKYATPNDKGLYTCRIDNYLQTNTLLNVHEGVPLKIVKGLFDLTVPEFERKLKLVVEVNKRIRNDPRSCRIRWFLNNREIPLDDEEYETFSQDNRIILRYLREILFDKDDNSSIECRIQEFKTGLHNIELSTMCRIFVEKSAAQLARCFTKKLDAFVQADSGLPVDLEARVNFDPELVKWFKNNVQIFPSQTYQLIDDPVNRSYILRIKNSRPKESGIYMIDADGLQCSGQVNISDTPVKFIQKLEDQFFDPAHDSSITLDCQLNKPAAMLGLKPTWFKNEIEIFPSTKYDMIEEHNICALIIYDLEESDEGHYRCQVGSESTQCKIRPEYILVKYLPNLIEPRETESCTLSFAINRAPNTVYSKPVTRWFKDGHELPEDQNKYWFIEHGNERSLTILHCQYPNDSGLYKAFIKDESTEPFTPLVATNSCQVAVKKVKVDFIVPLETQVIAHTGDTVKLFCETVLENLKPIWHYNEVLIEPGRVGNKEVYSAHNQHCLVINDAQESDTGLYKLKFGAEEFFIEVLVFPVEKPKQEKSEFIKHLKDVSCDEGETFELSCEFSRGLRDTDLVEWKRNGEFLVNSVGATPGRFDESFLKDCEVEVVCETNKCSLTVRNCHRGNAGNYEINVVALEPHQGKDPVVVKSACSVIIIPRKTNIMRPLPATLRINEGETLSLESFTSRKPSETHWFHNSIEIQPYHPTKAHESRVSVLTIDDGKIHRLEISNAKPKQHDGAYQLQVDDKVTQCEVQVKPIEARFAQRPPEFILFDKKKEAELGNDFISIECMVNKNAAPVKWYKADLEIAPNSNKYEMIVEGPIRCLLVHDVDLSDSGDYYCSLGSDYARTEVKVIDDTPKVNKVYEPKYEVIEVYEDKGLLMGVDLDSNEQSVHCKWFKDGQPLNFGDHIGNEIIEGKKNTLKITKLNLKDTGRYELIMRGQDEPHPFITLAIIDLKVKEKPISIVKKLSARKVQNDLLLLECEVSKPITDQFRFAWKKDGEEILVNDQHLHRRIAGDGRLCQLFINKFDYVDSGVYEFLIYDHQVPEMKETTNFRLDIKQNPFKSGMRVANNNEVNETRTLILEFETVNDTYNVNNMKWMKDNAPLDLTNTNKYKFSKVGPGKFWLEIRDLNAGDNGSYSCCIDEFSNKLNLSGIENIIKRDDESLEEDEELNETIEFIETKTVKKTVKKAVDAPAEVSQVDQVSEQVEEMSVEVVLPEVLEPAVEEVVEQKSEVTEKTATVVEQVVEEVPEEKTTQIKEVEEINEETIEEISEEIVEEQVEEITKKTETKVEQVEEKVPEEKVEEIKRTDEEEEIKEETVEEIVEEQVEEIIKKTETKTEQVNEEVPEEKVEQVVEEVKEETVEEKVEETVEEKIEENQLEKPVTQTEQVEEQVPEEKAQEIKETEEEIKEETVEEISEEVVEEQVEEITKKTETKTEQVEEQVPEEKVEETKEEVKEEKAAETEDNSAPTEEKAEVEEKPLNQVDQVEENVQEEKVEELEEEKKVEEEKTEQSDVPETEEIAKPEEVKEIEKDFEILSSNWKPEINVKETDSLELSLTINKSSLNPDNVLLYKDGVKVELTPNLRIEVIDKPGDQTEIKLLIPAANLSDSGDYKLCLKENDKPEQEIQSTRLKVEKNRVPVEVLSPLKADKTEYVENDEIVVSFKLKKPLEDKEKCMQWTLNGKPLDVSSVEVLEEIISDNEVEYKLIIKPAKVEHSGELSLKLLSNPEDDNSVGYDAKLKLIVKPEPLKVLDSNWKPELKVKENEQVELVVRLSKPIESIESLVLTKNGTKVTPSQTLTIGVEEKEGPVYEVKLWIPKAQLKDAGKLKLVIKSNDKKVPDFELGQTNLIVEEVPFLVTANLQPDKAEYYENDTIRIAIKVSKPVESAEKCVVWTLNGKPVDLKSGRVELAETKQDDGVEYSLTIKDVPLEKHDGNYVVKLKPKVADKKDIPSEAVKIEVLEKPINILDSNWRPEITINKSECLELFVKIDKKLKAPNDLIVYKETVELKPNDKVKLAIENLEDETCLIKLVFEDAVPEEAGKYKLCLKNKRKDLLGSTDLTVIPEETFEVNQPFKADKDTYFEGEEINLSVGLNKPVADIEQCIKFSLNGKILDLTSNENLTLNEERPSEQEVVYTMKIKAGKIGSDDGIYKVVILKKPEGIEGYSGEAKVVIVEKPIEVFDSDWKDEITLKEGENLELKFSVSKNLSEDDFILYKDGKELKPDNESVKMSVEPLENDAGSRVIFEIMSAQTKQSGKYKINLKNKDKKKEKELVASKITVEEVPITVLEPLSSEKPEYQIGETIKLSFKLNKPLADKDKCSTWTLNGKAFDMKAKNVKLNEEDLKKEGAVYTLNIENCDLGKHDGEFGVKLRSKPTDAKSEFYTGSVKVVIKDGEDLVILDSNWQPEIVLKEGENIELFVKINKPLTSVKDLALTKDGKKLSPTDTAKLSTENEKLEDGSEICVIKVNLNEAKPNDSGKYKLTFTDSDKKKPVPVDLGNCSLKVNEVPYEVLEVLKSDKDEYLVGESINLSFTLNKKLPDADKCVSWTLNGKPLSLKVNLAEEPQLNQSSYLAKIENCQTDKHSGEYVVKLRSKPTDAKSEFHKSSVKLTVLLPIKILESNWKPETKLKEGEKLDLFVKINQKPQNLDNFVLNKNGEPVQLNDDIKLLMENQKDGCIIRLVIPESLAADTGAYELKFKDTELGATNLIVEEVPMQVLEELNSSKPEYDAGETIRLFFRLSKPLPDKDKCTLWSLNDKSLDVKVQNIKFNELDESDKGTLYELLIDNCEFGKNEGDYNVKLKIETNFYEATVPVKIKKKLEILDSNWTPETKITENESVELFVKLSQPLDGVKDLTLTKDGKKLAPNHKIKLSIENVKCDDGQEICVVKVTLTDAKPEDGGKLKLTLKDTSSKKPVEVDLGNTNLIIEEIPLSVVEALKASKPEYKKGETIELTFKLSKPLPDKDKCTTWTFNAKNLDMKAKNTKYEVSENGVEFKLSISDSQVNKHNGEFGVKLRSKPTDAKSEFYSDLVKVSVKDGKVLEILDSNWKPEIKIKEGEPLELIVKINKPIEDNKSLQLSKDGKLVTPSEEIKLIVENSKNESGDDEVCLIKFNIPDSLPSDSGDYKLILLQPEDKDSSEKELGRTKLTVSEIPFEIIEKLKADKELYEEGDEIKLTFALSKPLPDQDKCVTWSLNGKPFDLKSANAKLACDDRLEQGAFYTLTIPKCEHAKFNGEFGVKVKIETDLYNDAVKIKVNPKLTVIDSNWKPETKLKENENLELFVKLNKPLEDTKNLVITKDGKKLPMNEDVTLSVENNKEGENDDDVCTVWFKINGALPDDGGKYKLTLTNPSDKKEMELGVTKLIVEEIPISVLEPLSSEKPEYQIGETIKLSFKLNKPLADKDKCSTWTLNGKAFDMKAKNVKLNEEDLKKEGAVYTLNIENCDLGKHDGEFGVKLRSKPTDAKSEFYTGSVKVVIKDGEDLVILDSNWQPEIVLKEGENIELFVKINKPLTSVKDLALTKDGKKVPLGDGVKLTVNNSKAEDGSDVCEIKLLIDDLSPADSGKYKLAFTDPTKKKPTPFDLGSTNLKVEEIPYSVIEPLKTDKAEYQKGDAAQLILILSKPLPDKDKCLVFTINNKPFDLKAKGVKLTEDKNDKGIVYTLSIDKCEMGKHDGEWKVKARVKPSDAKSEFYTGSVKLPVIDLTTVDILSKLQLKSPAIEGQDFTLFCKLSTPNLPVTWTKEETPLEPNKTKFEAKSDKDGVYSFTVKSASSEDCGVYKLVLPKNCALSKNSEPTDLELKVDIQLSPLKIVKDLEVAPNDRPFVKETATFTITLSKPDENLEWFKDGAKISEESPKFSFSTETTEEKNFKATFVIKDLDSKDSGKYEVRCSENICSRPVDLVVQTKKDEYQGELKLISPKFEIKENDSGCLIDESDSGTIQLECSAVKDYLKIQWYKNEKLISLSDKSLFTSEKSKSGQKFVYKLTANRPKNSNDVNYHSGKYYVQLDSKAKSNELEVSVSAAAPLVIEGEDVVEGGQVTLVAKVTKVPKNFEWLKNGQPIKDKRFAPSFDADELHVKLFIDNLQLSDSDIYTLKVDNAQSSYQLVVKELPLEFIKELTHEAQAETKTTKASEKLWCVTNKSVNLYETRYLVQWFKDEKLLDTTPSNKGLPKYEEVTEDQNKTHSLLVNDFDKKDLGKYQVKFLLKETNSLVIESVCEIVDEEPLNFGGDITSPNTSPLENKDNIEINFSLNKSVPVSELNNELEVLKDNSPVDPSLYSVEESPNDYKILFKSPAVKDDSGIYSLSLKTPQVTSPNSIDFKVLDKNLFIVELPETLELIEEEPLRLQVKCNQPVNVYKWLKDDQKLTVREEKLRPDKTVFAFNIASSKVSDSGAYEFVCEEFNAKSRCIVTVKPKPEKLVRGLDDLGTVRVKEGETIALKVKFNKPVPEEDLKLYLNGKEFVPNEHGDKVSMKFKPETNEYIITIEDSKPERDEGRYKLTSPNTDSECSVVVEEKPLKFVTELENLKIKILPVDLYDGVSNAEEFYPRAASFECQISKPTEISWFINEILLDEKHPDFSRIKLSQSEDGKTHSLQIEECSAKDSGLSVQIKLNKNGKKSSAVLKVEQLSIDSLIKLRKPLEDSRVKEGDEAKFECEVGLTPGFTKLDSNLRVRWLKNGQEITESEKIVPNLTADKTGQVAKLNVKKCSLTEDQGEYTCQFVVGKENPRVLLESKAKLVVKELEPVILKELPASLAVTRGEDFELECELSKPDLEVEWLKENKPLDNQCAEFEVKSYTTTDGHHFYSLRIGNSQMNDSGKFKLRYKNLQTECKVTVKEPKLEIKTPLENVVYVNETEDAQLVSEYSQKLDPELTRIEWFKGGKRLYFSNKSMKYRMELNEGQMKLVIKESVMDDEGDYEVRVLPNNEETPLVQKTQLKVVPLEVKFIEEMTDVNVDEGETAKMSFKVILSVASVF